MISYEGHPLRFLKFSDTTMKLCIIMLSILMVSLKSPHQTTDSHHTMPDNTQNTKIIIRLLGFFTSLGCHEYNTE